MDIKKAFLLGKFCVKLVVSGLVLLFLCQGPGVRYKPDKEFPSLTLVSDAYADVPARINYQGRYRENGIPVDGTRHFQFKLIDSQWSSGNVRYDSSDQSVTITKGLFHYVLEPALHATTWDNQSLWLHVWVGADSPDTHLDVGGVTNAGERVSSALYSYYSMSAYNATNATGTFTIDSSGGYSSAFTAGAQAGNVSYTLPTALPASNKYLQCTDAGVLSWETGGAEGTPGGDDGEVQYNNGGIFNGGDALYYDDGNSRLGIGTTSPGNKLHVLNTGGAATNAAGYFELTDASNSSFAMYAMAPTKAIYASGNINIKASQYLNFGETSGDSGYGIKDNGGTIQYKNSGGAGWANLTEAVGYWTRDAGNGYLYAATITDKLGIGTTAPGEELDLVGQLAITDSAFSQRGFIGKGLNDDFSIVSKNSTAWLRLGCGTSGAITFFTDGTAETGDNWKFAMYGDATYTRLILDFSAATAQKARLASIADGSIYLMANYNYDAGSWAKDNTSAAGSVIYAGTDYGLKVYTRTAADGDGSPSEKMTITLGGNVGIGTTDPAGSLLHTRNTAASNSAGYFELTNASNSSYAVYALGPTNAIYASGNIVVTGTVDGVDISTITFGSDDMGNHTATTNIQLGSNWLSGDGGNEGVYVGSTGNVGIGTSNPNNKLHIQGDSNGVALAILNQVGTNQYAGYRIDRDGTETWLLGVSNADDSLRLRYNGSTDNFVMDTIGNTTIAGDLTITGLDINSAADTKFGGGYGGTGVT
ncbi:MAG: hypothetical protein LHV69_11520, partial [Elusimicrobia bacterium]|nr:hypothetical protein [Candidatus Obscuribacterium magneticum]